MYSPLIENQKDKSRFLVALPRLITLLLLFFRDDYVIKEQKKNLKNMRLSCNKNSKHITSISYRLSYKRNCSRKNLLKHAERNIQYHFVNIIVRNQDVASRPVALQKIWSERAFQVQIEKCSTIKIWQLRDQPILAGYIQIWTCAPKGNENVLLNVYRIWTRWPVKQTINL